MVESYPWRKAFHSCQLETKMLLVFGHDANRKLACYLAAGNHETIIQAGSRAPSIPVPLAVVATTCRIQTGPSAIPGSIAWQVKLSSAWLSHCQDSGELLGSTSVCPVPHTLSRHCSYTNKTWKFVSRLDCCVSTEYSMRALYNTGGIAHRSFELALPLIAKQKFFASLRCCCDIC